MMVPVDILPSSSLFLGGLGRPVGSSSKDECLIEVVDEVCSGRRVLSSEEVVVVSAAELVASAAELVTSAALEVSSISALELVSVGSDTVVLVLVVSLDDSVSVLVTVLVVSVSEAVRVRVVSDIEEVDGLLSELVSTSSVRGVLVSLAVVVVRVTSSLFTWVDMLYR